MTDPDSQNLEWLVESRSRIQKILLTLFRFAEGQSDVLSKDYEPDDLNSIRQDLFALYAGAGFSLWRAVFLNEKDRKRSEIQHHAKDLLKILVEDNAIGFPQDKKTKTWMGGYYLNNAWFRLDEALLILAKHNMIADQRAFSRFTTLKQAGREEESFQNVWDILCDMLEDLFQLMQPRR